MKCPLCSWSEPLELVNLDPNLDAQQASSWEVHFCRWAGHYFFARQQETLTTWVEIEEFTLGSLDGYEYTAENRWTKKACSQHTISQSCTLRIGGIPLDRISGWACPIGLHISRLRQVLDRTKEVICIENLLVGWA